MMYSKVSPKSKITSILKLSKFHVIWLLDLAAITGGLLNVISFNVIRLIIAILCGTFASAGVMIINSGLEINRDKVMARTSKRPTVLGIISSREAIITGVIITLISLTASIIDGFLVTLFIGIGAFVYLIVYTMLLKPRTYWNIVIGGLAGSAAAWTGFAAEHPSLTLSGLLLGLLIFMWTPGHFWSLALRYKDDYKRANIPMLPTIVDEKTSSLSIFVSNMLMLPIAIYLAYLINTYFLIYTIIISALLLFYNIRLLRNPTKEEAWRNFKVSSPYLALYLIGVIIFSSLNLLHVFI